MEKVEKFKQLGIKVDICNCILPKKSWFRIFHEEDYTPVLLLVTEERHDEMARGIEAIDEYLAGYLELCLKHGEGLKNFLTGRIF